MFRQLCGSEGHWPAMPKSAERPRRFKEATRSEATRSRLKYQE
jgi:hypothetical protein